MGRLWIMTFEVYQKPVTYCTQLAWNSLGWPRLFQSVPNWHPFLGLFSPFGTVGNGCTDKSHLRQNPLRWPPSQPSAHILSCPFLLRFFFISRYPWYQLQQYENVWKEVFCFAGDYLTHSPMTDQSKDRKSLKQLPAMDWTVWEGKIVSL